ncbi:MAG: hypothetical protein V7K38_26715 [Nostoc sp.]|uniref:hypothetical protein n=1 Tax=Nostoc sp. TaxID=1180 RepID=UPI002FF907A7
MTQTTCPRCDCTTLKYQENYGYWECLDCGHVWALDTDDPDYDEEPLDLGACCGCGTRHSRVQNILTLQKKALIPGTGWSCFVCGIPADGAIAIVCDNCLAQIEDGKQILKQAVYGDVLDKKRCDINLLTEDFRHKDIPH